MCPIKSSQQPGFSDIAQDVGRKEVHDVCFRKTNEILNICMPLWGEEAPVLKSILGFCLDASV
jgi:hypothetical protein